MPKQIPPIQIEVKGTQGIISALKELQALSPSNNGLTIDWMLRFKPVNYSGIKRWRRSIAFAKIAISNKYNCNWIHTKAEKALIAEMVSSKIGQPKKLKCIEQLQLTCDDHDYYGKSPAIQFCVSESIMKRFDALVKTHHKQ